MHRGLVERDSGDRHDGVESMSRSEGVQAKQCTVLGSAGNSCGLRNGQHISKVPNDLIHCSELLDGGNDLSMVRKIS